MRKGPLFILPLLLLGGVLGPAATARAYSGEEVATLAREIAGPWPGLQRDDGSFADYVFDVTGGNGGYAEAMLGLGLIEVGSRWGDRRVVEAGLRGVDHAVDRPHRIASVFEVYAVAAAYNLAGERLHGDFAFAHRRDAWVPWLCGTRPIYLRHGDLLFNKSVVEAVAWLELARTGLRCGGSGTVLMDPSAARADAARYFNDTLPALARASLNRARGRTTALLISHPHHPLAYHALGAAFYARGLEMLGGDGGPAAYRLLRQMANASWAIAGPDGDVAYSGRSQEQAWVLAATAYAADEAADTGSPTAAGDLAELAARTLRLLRTAYPRTAQGLAITPAVLRPGGLAALDSYAGAGVYNGLTLVILNWLASGNGRRPGGSLAADRPGVHVVDAPPGDLAYVRSRDVWFGVHNNPVRPRDLRYDSGLVTAKRRTAAGWRDVVPIRPHTRGARDGAGPVLLRAGRPTGPHGDRLSVDPRRGRALLTVRYPGRRGTLQLAYAARRCGVKLSWHARPGERFEQSAFFAAPPTVDRRGAGTGTMSVRASRPVKVSVEGGYGSATEPSLWRARLALRTPRSGRLAVTFCG